ncbi:TetR/AcrR family transcriptional regulator [Halosimplex pelagicum]|uniref:TetR/AcrR family transcriptional regulator n=2 Tax=Halosimplex pelagicum TaxID=869886 RepID=A0A7D5PGX3_9EURY|nr:TetR/AcrR family transcriptional regulator [Halosimplex pelagicum]QLH84920.1 TetR/AcrR family transcriptional regulator [Halosimplex pelagicum]
MGNASETEHRIREAAFRALVKHGYADLSLTDIGNELGQNPSIIYHYYDSKDDLLFSMLETFVDIFVDGRGDRPITDPEQELREMVDHVLQTEDKNDILPDSSTDMRTAISRMFVELWTHAIWDDDFRRETTEIELRLKEIFTKTIRAGIERDQFRPVNPERTADHILFLLKQGIYTRVTTNRDDATERVHSIIDELIDDL